jgi:hypothetical protein
MALLQIHGEADVKTVVFDRVVDVDVKFFFCLAVEPRMGEAFYAVRKSSELAYILGPPV